MSDSEVLERWLEDDSPLFDAARVKERRVKDPAPVTKPDYGPELGPEDEAYLKHLDWQRRHGRD